MPLYELYSDGSVKNKIGYFGFVLFLDRVEIDRGWGDIGCGVSSTTAEYYGLSAGLDSFIRHINQPSSTLNCYSDCAPLVRNLNKVARRDTSHELQMLFWKLDQIRQFSTCTIKWVPRYRNIIADAVAKSMRPRI